MKVSNFKSRIVVLAFTFLFLVLGLGTNLVQRDEALASGNAEESALMALLQQTDSPQTAVDPSVYLWNQTIQNSGSSNDQQGYSVGISGNYAVVGAPKVAGNSGAAYIFERSGDAWIFMQSLPPTGTPTPATNDRFGFTVDISGDSIIVGAPGVTDAGIAGKGAAYIYTLASSTWGNGLKIVGTCEGTMGACDESALGDQFGTSVSIDGDTAVIGAPQDDFVNDIFSYQHGSVTKIIRTSGVWQGTTGIKTPGDRDSSGPGSRFGFSVSISGGYIMVGAPVYNGGSSGFQGSAYIYGSPGLVWATPSPSPTFTGSSSGDGLGNSVAIYDDPNGSAGDVAVMGANGVDPHGSAYFSMISGGNWSTKTALAVPTPAPTIPPTPSIQIGTSVAVDHLSIVIGDAPTNDFGSVYAFRYDGSSWNREKTLKSPTSQSLAYDGYGNSVALDGNKLIVGEYSDALGSFQGSASIYVNSVNPYYFLGDGRTNYSIYRPATSSAFWVWDGSSSQVTNWGLAADVPAPADYDGDGITDYGLYRPSTLQFFVSFAAGGNTSIYLGTAGDLPIPADFDSDGKADFAVYRRSNHTFYWYRSSDLQSAGHYLSAASSSSNEVPVIADFDGDGLGELAVFDNGSWYWYNLGTSSAGSASFGTSGDIPAPADYDGDLKTDLAIWRPSTQYNWRTYSSNSYVTAVNWGLSGDKPVIGDFDGDGEADVAVFRPGSSANFYVIESRNGSTAGGFGYGTTGDQAVSNAYLQP